MSSDILGHCTVRGSNQGGQNRLFNSLLAMSLSSQEVSAELSCIWTPMGVSELSRVGIILS